MDKIEGPIMSKKDFLKDSAYTKEPYEGILVSSDLANKQYKIGIQLSENEVMLVDKVSDEKVLEKVHRWIPHINEIQVQHGVKNDLENYSAH